MANQTLNSTTDKAKQAASKAKDFLKSGNPISQVILAIILFIIFSIITNFIMNLFTTVTGRYDGSPWLYKNGETKDAKKPVQVNQRGNDGEHPNTPVIRSTNQLDGIEFTYVFWSYIDDWTYKRGAWKHILHKGNDNSWPNRAPGIWFHPDENKMRVYMNTFSSVADSYIDVDNIPIDKWFHTCVMVTGRYLDVYINGNLKKRLVMDGIPKQNYGDVYINLFGGFSGFMSCIRYYDYSINPIELELIVKKGPQPMKVNKNETPPYLATNWWINNYDANEPPRAEHSIDSN
jgi:hypothetical protein